MTQEQFNQDYGRIAMPKPFAHDGLITPIVDIGDSTHPVNFTDGFPSEYSAPHSQGGKYVTRGEFNAIGNLATRNDFYKACGGLNTFNASLASKIGGYPKGAVLQLLDKNVLKYVISLVDNNTVNFNTAGVDGVNWMFCYESKHEEEDETYLGSVSETDFGLTADSSVTIFSKESNRSGALVIRGFKYEISEDQTAPGVGSSLGIFISSGIIARTIPRQEQEGFTPLYASADNAQPWICQRFINSGSYRPYSANGTFTTISYIASIPRTSVDGLTIKWNVQNGLTNVAAGDIVMIDAINGYSAYSPWTNGPSHLYKNISFSFDVYII